MIRIVFLFALIHSQAWCRDELVDLLSSQTMQQLNQHRSVFLRLAVQERTCRLQIQHRMVPTACLRRLHPHQITEFCLNIDPRRLSSQNLRQALEHKGWDMKCQRHLHEQLKRKFYQEAEPAVGASFESYDPNGTGDSSDATSI